MRDYIIGSLCMVAWFFVYVKTLRVAKYYRGQNWRTKLRRVAPWAIPAMALYIFGFFFLFKTW